MAYLDSNNLLHQLQSGFRQGHSCATALTNLYDDLLANCDTKFYSGLLLADFSKAFDRVHHDVLINKLHSLGISNPWFKTISLVAPSVFPFLVYNLNLSPFFQEYRRVVY